MNPKNFVTAAIKSILAILIVRACYIHYGYLQLTRILTHSLEIFIMIVTRV